MGKNKNTNTSDSVRSCATCGTSKQCQNCSGTGHWHSNKNIECGHCSGSGKCPINE